jgi:hypothetical protein
MRLDNERINMVYETKSLVGKIQVEALAVT